jgi:5S rRNA maturation endonuclease (ribonuclease M5)
MKKTPIRKSNKLQEMSAEYSFDYKKAKPNRFAEKMKDGPVIVLLDSDVAKVFRSGEEVNKALRALIPAMPAKKAKAVTK